MEEKAAKAARRAAAQESLDHWATQHASAVETRKASNRTEEEEKNADLLAALEGDSWTRVVSLVDVGTAEAGGKDITRMKDVLLQVKAHGTASTGGSAAAV